MLKLNDKECLLNDKECLEICNERKKPVQVGFQAWLQNKENIANDLNKEVIIKWPINTDILCAKSMERKLNCKGLQWRSLVVKILAIGGKYIYFFSNFIYRSVMKYTQYITKYFTAFCFEFEVYHNVINNNIVIIEYNVIQIYL